MDSTTDTKSSPAKRVKVAPKVRMGKVKEKAHIEAAKWLARAILCDSDESTQIKEQLAFQTQQIECLLL